MAMEMNVASRHMGESARPARLVVERAAYIDGPISQGLLLPMLDRTCLATLLVVPGRISL